MLVFHPAMVNCYRSCKSRDKAINISYVTHTSSDVTITFKIGSVYVVLPSCKVWFWACKTRDKAIIIVTSKVKSVDTGLKFYQVYFICLAEVEIKSCLSRDL